MPETPASEAAEVSFSVMVRHDDGVRVGRYGSASSLCGVLARVHAVVEEVGQASAVETIFVKGLCEQPKTTPVYFTNICGKCTHRPGKPVLRESVRAHTRSRHNAFGAFVSLYSPRGNLVVCQNARSTLFRGFVSTTNVKFLVDHSLYTEHIISDSVHLIVASARLGRPVDFDSTRLVALTQDTRWTCTPEPQAEDRCYRTSWRLSAFAAGWLAEVAPDLRFAPLSIVLGTNRSGSVDFFVSMDLRTRLNSNSELALRPLLSAIFERLMELV